MNYIDSYDIPSPSPSTPTQQNPQSLNDEVTQVVGQLSKLWGGFRKQSQTAFEAARKDIGQLASQAQKEITKLTAETTPSSSSTAQDAPQTEQPEADLSADPDDSPAPDPTTSDPQSTHNINMSQNLFSRLQSSLPPTLVSTVQSRVPESLKQGATSIDLNQLRSTLTSEFHRVQDITVHRSEGFLRDAQEFFKDAVKVVPPEENGGSGVAPVGVLWDGSDVWMLPEAGSPIADMKGKGKQRESSVSSGRRSAEGLRAVATRAEALLKQLRHDPEVIKVDPAEDDRLREMYDTWIRDFVDSREGGIAGSDWSAAVDKALQDSTDGEALTATRDALVPSVITSEVFWTRYFFRVYQVEREEERRKALLQDTAANDDDFSWEDEEEEPSSPRTAKVASQDNKTPVADTKQVPTLDSPPQEVAIPDASPFDAHASGRQSSEESYDVVSSQVSNAGDSKPEPKEAEDDDESDWE